METADQSSSKADPASGADQEIRPCQYTQFQDSSPDPGVELGFRLDLPDLDAILRDSSGFGHSKLYVRTLN